MTIGQLPADIVVNGDIVPDLRSFTTANLNSYMASHPTTAGRTVFYTQLALAEAGAFHGKIDGIVGPTNDLYNAFVALYDSNYSGPDYQRPANGQVSFKFYRDVMADNLPVDTSIYKVTS
jgi:hypothetical protein